MRRAGAQVVLVALHWGAEYRQVPTVDQRLLARRLLRSPDIDLVYGHHAHAVQPFERVRRRWVAYGLGSMASPPEEAEHFPTFITPFGPANPDMRLLSIIDVLPRGAPDAPRAALRAALGRIDAAVDLLGATSHGLTRQR